MDCKHDVLYNGLCVACGKDAAGDRERTHAVFAGSVLNLSKQALENAAREHTQTLARMRKLCLILDLDHTLLHATPDPRAQRYMHNPPRPEDPHSIRLMSHRGRVETHYVKFRPGVRELLHGLKDHYELYISSMAQRHYAEAVAHILDPDNMLFKQRIVSRSDNTGIEGVKALQNVVQCHPGMVMILDDRRDMWHSCVGNLIKVHPYHYFRGLKESYDRNQPREIEFEPAPDNPETEDNVLFSLLSVLKAVHSMFYPPNTRLKSPTRERTVVPQFVPIIPSTPTAPRPVVKPVRVARSKTTPTKKAPLRRIPQKSSLVESTLSSTSAPDSSDSTSASEVTDMPVSDVSTTLADSEPLIDTVMHDSLSNGVHTQTVLSSTPISIHIEHPNLESCGSAPLEPTSTLSSSSSCSSSTTSCSDSCFLSDDFSSSSSSSSDKSSLEPNPNGPTSSSLSALSSSPPIDYSASSSTVNFDSSSLSSEKMDELDDLHVSLDNSPPSLSSISNPELSSECLSASNSGLLSINPISSSSPSTASTSLSASFIGDISAKATATTPTAITATDAALTTSAADTFPTDTPATPTITATTTPTTATPAATATTTTTTTTATTTTTTTLTTAAITILTTTTATTATPATITSCVASASSLMPPPPPRSRGPDKASSSLSMPPPPPRPRGLDDARRLLFWVKKAILQKVHVLLPPEYITSPRPELWLLAEEFGAICHSRLSADVTHVLFVHKKSLPPSLLNAKAVHLDWLWHCLAHYRRADEGLFTSRSKGAITHSSEHLSPDALTAKARELMQSALSDQARGLTSSQRSHSSLLEKELRKSNRMVERPGHKPHPLSRKRNASLANLSLSTCTPSSSASGSTIADPSGGASVSSAPDSSSPSTTTIPSSPTLPDQKILPFETLSSFLAIPKRLPLPKLSLNEWLAVHQLENLEPVLRLVSSDPSQLCVAFRGMTPAQIADELGLKGKEGLDRSRNIKNMIDKADFSRANEKSTPVAIKEKVDTPSALQTVPDLTADLAAEFDF